MVTSARGPGGVYPYNCASLNYACPPDKISGGCHGVFAGRDLLKAFLGQFAVWVEKTGEERLKRVQWPASAELCVETFRQERVLRVHVRASWRCKSLMVVGSASTFTFLGIVLHYDRASVGGASILGSRDALGAKKDNRRGRAGVVSAAFYYLQWRPRSGAFSGKRPRSLLWAILARPLGSRSGCKCFFPQLPSSSLFVY